jgi:hypothetical protein
MSSYAELHVMKVYTIRCTKCGITEDVTEGTSIPNIPWHRSVFTLDEAAAYFQMNSGWKVTHGRVTCPECFEKESDQSCEKE